MDEEEKEVVEQKFALFQKVSRELAGISLDGTRNHQPPWLDQALIQTARKLAIGKYFAR